MKREKLIGKLDKLDNELKLLLDDLKNYDEKELLKKPGSRVWSPMQVLYHLYKSEWLSLEYVKKKVQYNQNLVNSGLITFFRSVLIQLGTRLPLKFKAARQVDVEQLPEQVTFHLIDKDWWTMRSRLRSFLLEVDQSFFNKNVYRHPMAGRLNLYQMLKFFKTHFRRHQKQIYHRLGTS